MKLTHLLAIGSALFLNTTIATAGEMKLDQAEQMNGQMSMDHLKHGDLVLAGAFTRATLPNQPVAGGFLTIKNTGDEDDILIGVSADFAGRGEIHEMQMVGDQMKMRELEGGLRIPAGETVTLGPGGYHVMFMQLEKPLIEGETVEVNLIFEVAGEVTMVFDVNDRTAKHAGHKQGS